MVYFSLTKLYSKGKMWIFQYRSAVFLSVVNVSQLHSLSLQRDAINNLSPTCTKLPKVKFSRNTKRILPTIDQCTIQWQSNITLCPMWLEGWWRNWSCFVNAWLSQGLTPRCKWVNCYQTYESHIVENRNFCYLANSQGHAQYFISVRLFSLFWPLIKIKARPSTITL